MVRGHYYVYQQATHGGGSAAAVAMAVVIDIVVTQWCLVLHIVHEQMPLPRLRWRGGGGGSAAVRCHDLEPRHRRQGSDNCRTTEPATLSKAIVVVVAQRQENLRPSRKAAKACPACTSYHCSVSVLRHLPLSLAFGATICRSVGFVLQPSSPSSTSSQSRGRSVKEDQR